MTPLARRHEVVEGEPVPAGAGERGSDLEAITRHGIPGLAEEGREFPFVVASPQCPASSQWVPEVTTLAGLLDEVEAEYRIDPSRIHVTGLSMGGYATWSLAVRYPERFAAVAPVCGGLWMQRPDPMRDVPVWAFHGEEDEAVPIGRSEEIVARLAPHRQDGPELKGSAPRTPGAAHRPRPGNRFRRAFATPYAAVTGNTARQRDGGTA
ncbi:prolyl oligopeptidase family serine peptidase [Streptomyces sp. NEAU-H3]|uniref:carboxylesterase family protein n=1 Tax=Streptomyces sp. NEAU-H3 TaxID=2720636 RepID=UPI00280A56FF|nr:PHB depolymerase family esterase [Streptomyces sp. NEAU-H3]